MLNVKLERRRTRTTQKKTSCQSREIINAPSPPLTGSSSSFFYRLDRVRNRRRDSSARFCVFSTRSQLLPVNAVCDDGNIGSDAPNWQPMKLPVSQLGQDDQRATRAEEAAASAVYESLSVNLPLIKKDAPLLLLFFPPSDKSDTIGPRRRRSRRPLATSNTADHYMQSTWHLLWFVMCAI